MAVSKVLLAAMSVMFMILLTATAASPAVELDAGSNAEHDGLHIEGHSAVVEAPALAGLASRSLGACRSYFPCGRRTIQVDVRRSFACFFREARLTPRSAPKPGGCRTIPYNCKAARCSGWRECLCEQCKSVRFTYTIYCERP